MSDEVMEIVEIGDGDTTWRFDRRFLESNWTCVWGKGCKGIGVDPAPELALGCCSMGAEMDGEDEARLTAAMAAMLDPARFQHHIEAVRGGIFSDASNTNTRVVNGGCIFLNRPGFAGGAGCALHFAALDAGESPVDWKPSVCWQLPIKVDRVAGPGESEVATMRRWERRDWGADGETMAWCCTEGTDAYVGDRSVIDSLGAEIEAIVGTEVFVELRHKLAR
ncbi:MAG: hypothetical protein AB7V43_06125 [Acidimicrobiia bacterium]